MVSYYFDSYAVIEITRGGESYKPYLSAEIVLTALNLIECYNSWLNELGEEKANNYFIIFKQYLVPILDEDIITGVKFRNYLRNRNKKYQPSFTDCIGYVIALRLGIKFLTGDNAFKGLENVE